MFNLFRKKKQQDYYQDAQPTAAYKLVDRLKRTRDILLGGITELFSGKTVIDQKLLIELEEKLLLADVGVTVVQQIITQLKDQIARYKEVNSELVLTSLQDQLAAILAVCDVPLVISKDLKPFVILLVGVNGSGKTTTIGKLAYRLQQMGYKVMLAAGDTYRAAAVEQLKIWGDRNNVTVIAQQKGSDSAAVLYDAFQAARNRDIDVLIADTAGRLHTQNNLMEELKKIKRILQKVDPLAPHETLLVLDATVGQNALHQVQQFHAAIGVSGICLTKLDGTAKGGMIFAIAQNTKIPIRFIGLGEGIDDLQPFVSKELVTALFY